ncbi:DUF645 family protein, partial [Vibrio cholerae]|nr:DUF645 family protein [Vibrio cholerae]
SQLLALDVCLSDAFT